MSKDIKEISINKKIEYLVRARYPLIYIVSSEEIRVENSLKRISNEREKEIFFWSITKGLEDKEGNANNDLREPIKVLEHIVKQNINGLFVLRDFHPYLNDPVVVRKLRDVNKSLKSSMKNIIILSPTLKVPAEAEKEFAVLDYDLPNKDDIDTIIEGILRHFDKPDKIDIFKDAALRKKVVEAAMGLTAEEAENVFAKSLVQTGQFDIDVIISEKEQIIRKSGVLEFYKASEDLSDIGGLENLKSWLNKRTKAFTEEARKFGLPQPKGIILTGIPGCGKSLTAKVISSMWKLPLLKLDVGKVFSSLVGSSEENVRQAVMTAESIAPSILWLDELEKGFSGVQSSGMSDGGTTARVFGTFLTWLQEKKSPVFVVATSNNVTSLPPELLRKGRFDEIFYIDLPNEDERKEIFRIHLKKRNRNPSLFDLEKLAELTSGFSGSEIEQIIISALYDAFDSNEDITDERLETSCKEMIPMSTTMSDVIDAIREWAKTRARKASIRSFADEQQDLSRKIEMN